MERDQILSDVKRIDPLCQENEDVLVTLVIDGVKKSGLPYEDIMANWEAHLKWWQSEYGEKDKRFLKATERSERKDIVEFLEAKAYKTDWNVTIPKKRDGYLFPSWINDKQLNDVIINIHDKIDRERKRLIADSGQNTTPGS